MKIYDLFISHAWKYNNEYYRLEELLKEYSYFNFRNYSVPEHDPLDFNSVRELVQKLDEQIRESSIVLVIGGMYCNYRKWIKKEIEIAKKYNKPILLIEPYGCNRIPNDVEINANKIVRWNTKSIVEAIRELVN